MLCAMISQDGALSILGFEYSPHQSIIGFSEIGCKKNSDKEFSRSLVSFTIHNRYLLDFYLEEFNNYKAGCL